MKKSLFLVSLFCLSTVCALAQGGGGILYRMGNSGYSGGPERRTSGAPSGNLSTNDPKDSVPVAYVEANVLINVKADEYLAVFGVVQEGATLADGRQKLDDQIKPFLISLDKLGVKTNDVFVDFIAQNRVYDFAVSGDTANEKLSGFEVKKNVAAESSTVNSYNQRVTHLRKSSTFYYNPLHPAEFDSIIHPMGSEPMVQLTLYLRLKCELQR